LDIVTFGQKSKVNDDSVNVTIKVAGAPEIPWVLVAVAIVGGAALLYLATR